MPGNSFGKSLLISTFGESHGKALGVIIDGFPSGFKIDFDKIQFELDRRKPGQSKITTQRKESDKFDILSGVFEGKSTGTPISALVYNENQKSEDYDHLRNSWRPSHADFTYDKKYGFRDYKGGGRASARETVARVLAGAICKQYLEYQNIEIQAFVSQVGLIKLEKSYLNYDLSQTENNIVRCPDSDIASKMIELIEQIRKKGDTIGGVVTCTIKGCPIGLGEPVFDKLQSDLAKAMMSLPAAKGFDYGSGFEGVTMLGSEHNDQFEYINNEVKTKSNYSGGIQGGISNGMDIFFRTAFKPVATILQKQNSIDNQGNNIILEGKGRHDPCVLPRAVPIVEAMAAIVILDHLLRNK